MAYIELSISPSSGTQRAPGRACFKGAEHSKQGVSVE
jgi:hypothetical protein